MSTTLNGLLSELYDTRVELQRKLERIEPSSEVLRRLLKLVDEIHQETTLQEAWSQMTGEAAIDDTDASDILQYHFPATDAELYAQNRRRIAEHQGRLV